MNSQTKRAGILRRWGTLIWAIAMLAVCFLVTILTDYLVSLVTPIEQIPRVDQTLDGTQIYYCESVRNIVLSFTFPIVLAVTALVIFAVRTWLKPPIHNERNMSQRITHAIKVMFALLALGVFGSCCLLTGIMPPIFDVRVVDVGAKTVEFRSLVNSWTIPRGRIAGVDVVQTAGHGKFKNGTRVHAIIHVRDRRGVSELSTILQRFDTFDKKTIDDYLAFLESMKADLLK